jgi:hypothetical protein
MFTASNLAPVSDVWGGGWTNEDVPTAHGWRCRQAWPGGPFLLGQRGEPVCATLRYIAACLGDEGYWDVAIYWDETPEQVVAVKCKNLDPTYVKVANIPGFGLEVIQHILRQRRLLYEATCP